MSSTTIKAPTARDQLAARCSDVLSELHAGTPGLLSATVASSDGLGVASTLDNKREIDKLAAMSCSIAALAAAMTRETGQHDPERVILETGTGVLVSMKVPGDDVHLVLTVVASQQAVLGKLLWSCREASRQLAVCAQRG